MPDDGVSSRRQSGCPVRLPIVTPLFYRAGGKSERFAEPIFSVFLLTIIAAVTHIDAITASFAAIAAAASSSHTPLYAQTRTPRHFRLPFAATPCPAATIFRRH